MTLQVLKLFALSRVSMKHLSTLPGMPYLPELDVVPVASAQAGAKKTGVKGVSENQ